MNLKPPKPLSLDVNFLNPFIEGFQHTLQIQCFTESKVQTPFLRGEKVSADVDIAGIIGFECREFSGYIAMCFTEKTFLSVMSKMLKEPIGRINAENRDGAAELLNIVCGNAAKTLNANDYGLRLALPTISTSKTINNRKYRSEHAIPTVLQKPQIANYLNTPTSFIIPFEIEEGPIFLEVNIQNDLRKSD